MAANPENFMQGFASTLPMLLAMVALFYFILVRPQANRTKAHQSLLDGLAKDEEVMTTGGIIGKILKIKDNFIVLTIAKGIEITVQKQHIASVLPKGTLEQL